MVVESHLPFGGEAEPPQNEASFEPAKPRRKSRRERHGERTRAHEHIHVLEPHTIWTREDPNHLQPVNDEVSTPERPKTTHTLTAAHGEQKAARSVKHESGHARDGKTTESPRSAKPASEKHHQEALRPGPPVSEIAYMHSPEPTIPAPQKREALPQKSPQPEPLAELLKLQELPKLNIQRRNFYTEPEVRQPNATEIEHDILPPTSHEGQSSGPITGVEQSKPIVGDIPPIPGLQNTSELQSGMGLEHHQWQQAAAMSAASEQFHTSEPLQRATDETSRQAAELASEEERRRAPVMPEALSRENTTVPERQFDSNEVNVHMEHADLLALGDSIRVDGVSASEMFHAGRLDEEGLRRIVAAFLRGHDAQRVVAEEVLRVQMRFERDPQLRQTALKRSSRTTKRAAGATTRAKKVLDPKRAIYHADHLADRLVDGLDRMMESTEGQPNMVKTVGIALAVVIYFVILILILKS